MEVNAPRVSMGRVCRFGAARSIVLSLLLASAGAPMAHHTLLAEGRTPSGAVLHRPYCGTLITPTARLRLRGGAAEAAMPVFRYVACESTPSRRDRARKRPEEEADDGIDDETLQKLMVIDEDRVQALLKDQTTAKKERRRRKRTETETERKLKRRDPPERHTYMLKEKPRLYVTTTLDDTTRLVNFTASENDYCNQTLTDFVGRGRLFSVGTHHRNSFKMRRLP